MQQEKRVKKRDYASNKKTRESQGADPSSDERIGRRQQSLYLDIYRNGNRSYEYLKMYIIPETDDNARKRNATTMTAANTIKSRRIIELTNGEAGIKRADNQETVLLLDWMNTYMENQQKRGKKDGHQIKVAIQILKDYAGERVVMEQVDKTFCQGYIDYLLTEYRPQGKPVSKFTAQNYYRVLNGALNAAGSCRCNQDESLYENRQLGQDTSSRKQAGVYDHRRTSGVDRHPDEE